MNRRTLAFALVLSLGACSGGKSTAQGQGIPDDDPNMVHVGTTCDRYFFHGLVPQVQKASLAQGLKRICYSAYAVAFSPISRTPMWSAEIVDSTRVTFARKLQREDVFHPEAKLKSGERAELADYRGSGYDRGHMTPSGDMPTEDAQHESFTLANMVPQAAKLNRGSWAELESDVRAESFDVKRIYVVTGPVFNGKNVTLINNRVMIPSHVWKAILIPEKGATVYVASNTPYPIWKSMSVADFTAFSGINPFPDLPDTFAKKNMATSDKPSGKDAMSGGGGSTTTYSGKAWDKDNCGAPWRPQNDPHYGHCHPIEAGEAQYGLTPGTMGSGGGQNASDSTANATGYRSGDDGRRRQWDRDRDRRRDMDR